MIKIGDILEFSIVGSQITQEGNNATIRHKDFRNDLHLNCKDNVGLLKIGDLINLQVYAVVNAESSIYLHLIGECLRNRAVVELRDTQTLLTDPPLATLPSPVDEVL